MGRTVSMRGLPRIEGHSATPAIRIPAQHVTLSFETLRLPGSQAALADVAVTALSAAALPAWLARKLSEAARVSAQFIYGHSHAPRYRLLIVSDGNGITVAVTDYEDLPGGRPAWLDVTRANTLQHDGIQPGIDPLTSHTPDDGLRLHRTPDGHIRLGCHAPWNTTTNI
ncbi:hypothetical protein [Streptomyces sp. SID1034]|uniref:hypothetical protein n=1 Tax=Streptomyces sp. SID1034 TaxID=2690248 RepID=UPI001371AD33|nr:hypothetical protein [Streptomyces sp. SID1034]MYV93464.1 hypothetical protein [Streptomyces sp. SID1034]